MFKNWAEVRIKDDRVESKGAVHVYDDRTSPKRKPDYYPTAEQARQIEPEIRHDIIDRIVQNTLNRVQEAAKEGRTNCRTFAESYTLTVAERFHMRKLFEDLGYETTLLECPVEMVKW